MKRRSLSLPTHARCGDYDNMRIRYIIANAIQAAPVGLATAISGAALAGAAASNATTTALVTKTIIYEHTPKSSRFRELLPHGCSQAPGVRGNHLDHPQDTMAACDA